ncbi:hypothetical protein M6B38_251580 [Iris pallida]|uniref:Uncharacterized protein n=1 Tax=Iris pallida TaxID=29817 RepID=A0AAX6IJR3_IRIPA|nr:hypothetical protein M6B38_132075 [Iris pallida]KAJ6853183.1 hypothetical protein M6B38_251580 [Iris pallida]
MHQLCPTCGLCRVGWNGVGCKKMWQAYVVSLGSL